MGHKTSARTKPTNGKGDPQKYLEEVIELVKAFPPPDPADLSGTPGNHRVVVLGPDARLRGKSEPVETFDEHLRGLVADLAHTMYEMNGVVGLSAPQIGDPRRVFVVDIFTKKRPEDDPEKKLPQSQLLVAINPVVWPIPGPTSREIEGCASFPSIYGHVTRPERIILKAFSMEGKPFAMAIGGTLARAIQHEYDHLEGMVVLDRYDPVTRRVALKTLSRRRRDQQQLLAKTPSYKGRDPFKTPPTT